MRLPFSVLLSGCFWILSSPALVAASPNLLDLPEPERECVVSISASRIKTLFDMYVPHGSNGRDSAAAVYLVDESGTAIQRLFAQNHSVEQAVASTQKIVTAWVAIKYGNLKQSVAFTEADMADDILGGRATYPGTSRQLRVGDEATIGQYIHTLLVQSSNGAALAIARGIGRGSISRFVALMNQEVAALLQYTDVSSYFQNPSGLTDAEPQYVYGDPNRTQLSTASNMARLIGRIMSDSRFRSAMGTIGLSAAKDGELSKVGSTNAAGKTIVARMALPGHCSKRAIALAFFGESQDDQFARFRTLIARLREDIKDSIE